MNVISLTGNICRKVELRYTKNNKGYVENTIGVYKDKKTEDGKNESDFIDFFVFDSKADYLSKYANKGDKIEIVGKLRVDTKQTENGDYKTKYYVVADSIRILTSRVKEEKKEEIPF